MRDFYGDQLALKLEVSYPSFSFTLGRRYSWGALLFFDWAYSDDCTRPGIKIHLSSARSNAAFLRGSAPRARKVWAFERKMRAREERGDDVFPFFRGAALAGNR